MMQENDRADDDPEDGIALDDPCDVVPPAALPAVGDQTSIAPPPSLASFSVSSSRNSISPRQSKAGEKKMFFALMTMQMHNELTQRAHKAREQAASRAQLTSVITGLATAYLTTTMARKREKKKGKKRKYYSSSSSSSSSSESESDYDNEDDNDRQKHPATVTQRSAD